MSNIIQGVRETFPIITEQLQTDRCANCGQALVGVSRVNVYCSPCYWARSQNQDAALWKASEKRKADSNQEKTKALKHDDGKLPIDLFAPEAIEAISKVLQHGTIKYSANNWREGFKWSRIFSGIMRHLWAFWRGEDIDPESGLPHVDHAGCGIMFLIVHFHNKLGIDNRYKKEKENGSVPNSGS